MIVESRRARTTHAGTPAKRAEVLDAALRCFSELGYERSTISEIRRRAGVSIGSLYHHFSSKEQLFAALYLETIRDTQAYSLRALARTRSAEEGVRALVGSYLRWVQRNPEKAAFLFTMRRAEFMVEAEAELEALNQDLRKTLAEWTDRYVRRGELPLARIDLFMALLVGPSEDFARRWLRGKTTTPVREAAELLGEAAWRALTTLGRKRND